MLLNTPELNVGGVVARNIIEVREVQLANTLEPNVVTLLGIVTEVSEVQLTNVCSPILVTPFGMFIDVSEEQLWNA